MSNHTITTKSSCKWEYDDDDFWEASCGDAFMFADAGPFENNFKFCPYCGKPLVVEENK